MDQGTYICESENFVGSVSASASLIVHCKCQRASILNNVFFIALDYLISYFVFHIHCVLFVLRNRKKLSNTADYFLQLSASIFNYTGCSDSRRLLH